MSDTIGQRLAGSREVPDMGFDRPGPLPAIPDAILKKWQGLVDTMADIVGVPAGLIMRIAQGDIEVLIASGSDANPYRPGDSEHLVGSGLYCETVIKNRHELLVPDAIASEEWKNNPDIKLNMISYLGLPILWPDKTPFGTICVLDNKSNSYSDKYRRLIEQFRNTIEDHLALAYMDARRTATGANTRFDDLLARLPLLVYEYRIDGKDGSRALLYANEKGAALFELNPTSSDAVAEFVAFIHPDDRERVSRQIGELPRTSILTPYRLQYRMVLPRGGLRYVDSSAEVVREANGDILLRGVLTDVTALMEAEEKLRLQQERLALATEASGQGVWDSNTVTGEGFYDRRLCEIFGIDADDPDASTSPEAFDECLHPADREWVVNERLQALAAGKDLRQTYRIVTPAGELKWITASARAVENRNGAAGRLVGVSMDITEAHRLSEELQRSNESFKKAEKLARIGSWQWEIGEDRLTWSDMIYEMGGWDPATPPKSFDGLNQILTPESFSKLKAMVRKCLRDGEPYTGELAAIRSTGEHFFISVRGEAIADEQGRIGSLAGTVQDITERRNAEDRIRSLNERLELAISAGGVGIWETDIAGGRYLFNAQMHEIYDVGHGSFRAGVPPDTFSENFEDWFAVVHPDDLPTVLQSLETARKETSLIQYEHRILRSSGEVRHVRTAAQMIRDESGAAVRAIGTTLDVTEQRRLTDALSKEKELLVLATRAGGVGIAEIDFTNGRQHWDEQIHAIHGIAQGDFDGTLEQWMSFIHPDDWEKATAAWQAAISDTSVLDLEHRIVQPSGAIRHIRAQAEVQRNPDGTPKRAIGTIRDVTADRHAAEALEAAKEAAEGAERAKSGFLAMMSHEIRTPLNTVLGMTQLALQTDLTPKLDNYLSKVESAAKALVAIVNDLLDLSKIEAGKLYIEEAEFTLESVLESVSAVTAMKAEEKGLEIVYAVEMAVPDRIVGDQLRLGQVLINLVNNAVKFTERGEIVVSVAAQEKAQGGLDLLCFTVRDTGIGLNADQIAGLFQAFSQADAHTSRKYGGTGLGLAICKQFVEMMGGHIWATSEPGRGSSFSFTIKAKLPAGTSPTPRAIRKQLPELAERRVLIVDDSASARDILTMMAQSFGMETKAAPSGATALDMLTQASRSNTPFDLVLMDWRMPGMDGLETARLIKADFSLRRTPAVLMVTAFAREEILRRAEQLGLEGVLIKPVTESVLFNTIAEALGCGRPDDQPTEKESRRELSRLRGRHVLLVDDDASNREIATIFLERVEMIVEAAASGAEAIARMQASRYDIVLMDSRMPDMDGPTVTRMLRQDPRFALTPILALTANTHPSDRSDGLDAGMNDYLTKPIDTDQLYAALLRWLPEEPARVALAGRRALVVDDNALNREVLTDFLISAGMDVDAVGDGAEALSFLDQRPRYDVVLMDVQMPGMDGLTATREIRKQPRWADLPIVAVTALAQTADREASLKAGMNVHLAKPINESLLYETLSRLLLPEGSLTSAKPDFPVTDTDGGPVLPDFLPGVNLSAASARLGGKRDRLVRLLRGFVCDFASAPAKLSEELAAGRFEAVGAMAHTIKSAAGYLGADALSDVAARLEGAVRRRDAKAVTEHASDFGLELSTVLLGLNGLFVDAEEAPPSAIDGQILITLIAQAEPLVAQGDYEAQALLEEIARALSGTTMFALAEAACTQFGEIELAEAGATLQRLRIEIERLNQEKAES